MRRASITPRVIAAHHRTRTATAARPWPEAPNAAREVADALFDEFVTTARQDSLYG
jgi:hypothetical protein